MVIITSCDDNQYHHAMGLVMERAIFDPPQLRDPSPIFMKLEIYNYFPDATPHAEF